MLIRLLYVIFTPLILCPRGSRVLNELEFVYCVSPIKLCSAANIERIVMNTALQDVSLREAASKDIAHNETPDPPGIGAREYGDVHMSGDSVAHLGDNNLYGPISINQLTVLIRDETMSYSSDEIPSIRTLLRPPPQRPSSRHKIPQSLAKRLEYIIGNGQTLAKLWLITSTHIQDALRFREESFRQYALNDAHNRTFDWAFEPSDNVHASLVDWLSHGSACFWISGKAGSGKSILMKYVSQHTGLAPALYVWAGRRNLVLSEHYFWYAGTTLQKSHEGVLRSLLRQILAQRPDITPILFPGLAHHLQRLESDEHAGILSIQSLELQKAFDMLSNNVPEDVALFLMIDGIDEYSGDLFEFCKLLMRLGKNSSIKILMSSRPVPACSHRFAQYPSLRMQDLTHDDIERYIDEELMVDPLLQDMDSLEQGLATQIKQALVEKASGVFLWIVLVVKDLLVGLGDYDDPAALQSRIDKLPSDLEHLYDHMLARLAEDHQKEGSMLLQIIKRGLEFQGHRLGALQLSFANFSHTTLPSSIQQNVLTLNEERLRIKMIDGRLRSRCCGLVEVQYLKNRKTAFTKPRVGFIHRTVVEYLNQYSIWERVASLCPMRTDDMDMLLLATCLATLNAENDQGSDSRDRIQELFESCVIYSKLLQKVGESSYVSYLEAAEQKSLDRLLMLQGATSARSRFRWHNELYHKLSSEHLYEYDTDGDQRAKFWKVTGSESNNSLAMFCIAILGLNAFWFHKLTTCSLTLSSITDILIHLLAITSFDSELLAAYGSSIEMLLGRADPNRASGHITAQILHVNYGLGPVRNSVYTKSSMLSAWSFWLGIRIGPNAYGKTAAIADVQDLRILAGLVNAGAELTSGSGRKASALTALREELERSKADAALTSKEGQLLLDDLLYNFNST